MVGNEESLLEDQHHGCLEWVTLMVCFEWHHSLNGKMRDELRGMIQKQEVEVLVALVAGTPHFEQRYAMG